LRDFNSVCVKFVQVLKSVEKTQLLYLPRRESSMMEGGRRYLALLTILQLYQGLNGQLRITPTYTVVNPGEPASFMCKYEGAIDSCQFTVGGQNLFMKPGREKDGISYHGEGLHVGECGIMIKTTQERHNGNITCAVAPDSADPTARTGIMQLVVALAPQKPELDVSVGTENNVNTYRERDLLSASCIVRDGRPAANITWYMGDEVITEGLKMPIETCTPQKKELCTIQQNLTRTLHANDDKKVLKCIANHHALRGRDLVAEYTINVNYPPKPSYKALERFGLVEGAIGRVPIMIEANPKPIISWTIGGDVVYEGTTNNRYTVEPTLPKGPGQYETVLVIDSLTREDTDKEYKVTAHNDLGEAHYTVIISTSPEPRVLEMGAGLIIVIVGAIVVILLILGGVFYARAKGKLCFAAGDAEKRVAPPNEGTENPAVNHHASSEYINNSPELKKEKPKEDTPV